MSSIKTAADIAELQFRMNAAEKEIAWLRERLEAAELPPQRRGPGRPRKVDEAA